VPDPIFDLSDKVIIVTGAGSGIGQGVAVGLAARGAKVVGFDVSEPGLAKTLDMARGFAFETAIVDVAVEQMVVEAFAAVESRHGRLDVVFANAGVSGLPIGFEDLSLKEWREVHAINLDGAFLVAREAARLMKPRGKGKIVFTASTWGVRGTTVAPFIAYASSKGAIVNLTRQLALELAPFGIAVNCIAPGGFSTNIAAGLLDEAAGNRLLAKIPFGRFAQPQEMVGPAVFLASAASDWVSGAMLPVDGGYLAE
jgi:gluconate 5-dehydrogenase